MKRTVTLLVILCLVVSASASARAAGVPAVASSVTKAIFRYFGKEGSEEAAEYLSKKGGQEILERVSSSAAKQGGDETVEQVAKLAGKHGPDALAALDNAPSIAPVIKALDELPESQLPAALVQLAAGKPGKELAETVARHGAIALRSELMHPGVGMILVRSLGDDGAELAVQLSNRQAIAIGRHAEDIAKLPPAQRDGVIGMFKNNTDRMVSFVGRFVEENPGKSLFTVAATTVILAEPERILGGDEVAFDAQGNPIVVSKAGVVGRTMDAGGEALAHTSQEYLQPLFYVAMVFAGTFVTFWLMIKLWHLHRREKAKTKAVSEK